MIYFSCRLSRPVIYCNAAVHRVIVMCQCIRALDSGQVGATEPVAKANENGWSLHKSARPTHLEEEDRWWPARLTMTTTREDEVEGHHIPSRASKRPSRSLDLKCHLCNCVAVGPSTKHCATVVCLAQSSIPLLWWDGGRWITTSDNNLEERRWLKKRTEWLGYLYSV